MRKAGLQFASIAFLLAVQAMPCLAQTVQSKDGTVESFFQINPAATQPKQKARSIPYYLYKSVWHFFDNVGVPMLFTHDHSIAPDQKPPLPPVSVDAAQPPAPDGSAGSSPAPQKIPDSELEGTIYGPAPGAPAPGTRD